MEFSADPGKVFLPAWLMRDMLIREGAVVQLTNTQLPKCTYVKLQPQDLEFLELSDPKAVLEKTLERYSCFTLG